MTVSVSELRVMLKAPSQIHADSKRPTAIDDSPWLFILAKHAPIVLREFSSNALKIFGASRLVVRGSTMPVAIASATHPVGFSGYICRRDLILALKRSDRVRAPDSTASSSAIGSVARKNLMAFSSCGGLTRSLSSP